MIAFLIRISVLISLFFAFLNSAYSQQTNFWVTEITKDRFTDKKNPIFSLRAMHVDLPVSLGQRQVVLMLSCSYFDDGNGKFSRLTTGMVFFTPSLQMFNKSFTYRFDKSASKSFFDPSFSSYVSLGHLKLSEFLTSLTISKKLLIRIWSESTGAIDAEFDLSESKSIKKDYLAACGPI
jgi:hypothetical protein